MQAWCGAVAESQSADVSPGWGAEDDPVSLPTLLPGPGWVSGPATFPGIQEGGM